MALSIVGEQNCVVLTEDIIKTLLSSENTHSVRLYLYLRLNGCAIREEELCAQLKLSERELAESCEELIKLGLAKNNDAREDELDTAQQGLENSKLRCAPPKYSKEEIITLKKQDGAFAQIVKEASELIKPLLTESDLRELMTIYGYFGMPAECLIMLIHFTAARAQRQSDGMRRPSMMTVKKEAFRWLDRGITTAQRADEFIREENRIMDIVEGMEKTAGLDIYTNDNRRLLRSWAELGFDAETVEIARDITKSRLGEINLLYMGRIIKNWKKENLTDANEILKHEKLRQREQEMNLTAKAQNHRGKKTMAKSGKNLSAKELETLKAFGNNGN